jgi:hypothetical protein
MGIVILNPLNNVSSISQPTTTSLLFDNTDPFQNIIGSNPWPTWNDFCPDIFLESLIFWKDAPIGTGLCFEPFEIINLIPLVLDWLL